MFELEGMERDVFLSPEKKEGIFVATVDASLSAGMAILAFPIMYYVSIDQNERPRKYTMCLCAIADDV